MKLLMIAYGQAVDDEVWDILADNIIGCTEWKSAASEEELDELVHLLLVVKRVLPPRPGDDDSPDSFAPSPLAGEFRLGTTRRSKLDNVLMVVLDDALAGKVMDGVRAFRSQFGLEGIKAFMLPCEDCA